MENQDGHWVYCFRGVEIPVDVKTPPPTTTIVNRKTQGTEIISTSPTDTRYRVRVPLNKQSSVRRSKT